jgi:hypothetical protein
MSGERGGQGIGRLCLSMFLEMSCLGTRVPADPNEVEHHLVAEWCVVVSAQFVVLRAVASCPGRCSRWSSALGKSRHFTKNKWPPIPSVHVKKNFHSFTILCSKPHVASSISLRHNFSKLRMDFVDTLYDHSGQQIEILTEWSARD